MPMTTHAVTLNVPGPLYDRVKQRAQRANRPVEAEFLDVLTAAVPASDELPPDLAEAIAPLCFLDDESLWRAARTSLTGEAAERLQELHDKKQREGLTKSEAQTVTGLVREYERAMLVRAQAAALLKQRGHDVSELLACP
jgi:plasmid stability protein